MKLNIKKISLITASALVMVLSVFSAFAPISWGSLFGVHRLRASSNIDLAQFNGIVNVKNNQGGLLRQIVNFQADTVPMQNAFFINSDLTGSAIRDSNNSDVPYMPPSANNTSDWYLWVDLINQNATRDYTLYTANEDLNGDIVYMPAEQGMTVAGNSDMDLNDDDFRIEINGYFNPNSQSINNKIFQNDSFELTYQNGILSFNALDAIGGYQTVTVATFPVNYSTQTLGDGKTAVINGNNNGTAYVTIVAVPQQTTYSPTTSTKSANSTTITTNKTTSRTVTSSITGTFGQTYPNGQYTTYISDDETIDYYVEITAEQLRTILSPKDYAIYETVLNNVVTLQLYNGNSTVIEGNGATTITMTGVANNIRTISAVGSNGVTTATSKRTLGGNNTQTYTTKSTENAGFIGSSFVESTSYRSPDQQTTTFYAYTHRLTTWITSLLNTTTYQSAPTTYTTFDIKTNGSGSVGVADGQLAYGLQYVYLNSSAQTASWAGGDTTLVIERKNGNIQIYDELAPNDVIITMPVADGQQVLTSDVANWTFAQNGAMPFVRDLKFYKDINNTGIFDDTTLAGEWKWEKGNTFTDLSGNGHYAVPTFISSSTNPNLKTTLSNYGSIADHHGTVTTTTRQGLVDTTTPDPTLEVNEEKWKDILFLGILADTAQEGGIPLSLIFVPLLGMLAVFVHFIVYKYTRDMLISGIAGCTCLGLGIALNVLYTFPLVIGILIMFVLLVKRKTISM